MIFITIKNVLMHKDINSATAATMEAFNKIGFVSPERRYEAPTVARPPQM